MEWIKDSLNDAYSLQTHYSGFFLFYACFFIFRYASPGFVPHTRLQGSDLSSIFRKLSFPQKHQIKKLFPEEIKYP